MLDTYLDRGGNFVDTANVYTGGHSEEILGDALAARPGLRDRIVLASKFYANLDPELRGWSPAIALQLEYSLLERTVEGELVPMARELGMGVMPWSPLRNGYLTGKHPRGSADARGGIVPGLTEAEWEVIVIGARSVGQLQANPDSLALELSEAQLEPLNASRRRRSTSRPTTTRDPVRCSPSVE